MELVVFNKLLLRFWLIYFLRLYLDNYAFFCAEMVLLLFAGLLLIKTSTKESSSSRIYLVGYSVLTLVFVFKELELDLNMGLFYIPIDKDYLYKLFFFSFYLTSKCLIIAYQPLIIMVSLADWSLMSKILFLFVYFHLFVFCFEFFSIFLSFLLFLLFFICLFFLFARLFVALRSATTVLILVIFFSLLGFEFLKWLLVDYIKDMLKDKLRIYFIFVDRIYNLYNGLNTLLDYLKSIWDFFSSKK